MNQVPCINPTCSHLFSASELTGAAIKCPKCGQVIQVRAPGAPAPPPPPPPPPAPRKPAPLAAPVAKPAPPPSVPRATPAAPPAPPPPAPPAPRAPAPAPQQVDPLGFAPSPPRPAHAPRPPSPPSFAATAPDKDAAPFADDLADLAPGGYRPAAKPPPPSNRIWLRLLALAFICVGGVLIIVLAVRRFRGGDERAPTYEGDVQARLYDIVNSKDKAEKAFKLVLPKDKQWKADEETRKKYKALAAWRDGENDVVLAVLGRDFFMRKPRDSELTQLGREALDGVYDESLEMDQTPEAGQVGGEKTRKFKFKGRDGAVLQFGEMHLFTRHGIGYAVVAFGPPGEEKEFERVQSTLKWLEDRNLGFAFADERRGWTEQPPPMQVIASASGAVILKVPERVYERSEKIKVEGETEVDLYLLGRFRTEKDNRKNAHVQVYRLEGETAPEKAMEKAKEFVLAQTAAGTEGYKLIVAPDAEEGMGETGKEAKIGDKTGRIGDFCMTVNDKKERFFAIGVVNEGDRLTLIACDVIWEHRQIWASDFRDLLAAATVKK